MSSNGLTAEEFDEFFDRGENVSALLDVDSARRVEYAPRRVNVDFPTWMVDALDRQPRRLGVPRESIIKLWIAERIDRPANSAASRTQIAGLLALSSRTSSQNG